MKMASDKMAKATAKQLEKGNIFLERKDDMAYITNGFWLMKMPMAIYNLSFRPASPMFVELNKDDTVYVKNFNDGLRMPQENPKTTPFCVKLWDDFEHAATDRVKITPFIKENAETYPNKNKQLRLCAYENGTAVWLDESYYNLCRMVEHGDVRGEGKTYSPIVFANGDFGIEMVILPVRNSITNIHDIFREAA